MRVVHLLGGPATSVETIKKRAARGAEYAARLALRYLFDNPSRPARERIDPARRKELEKRAVEPVVSGIFQKGIPLLPSLAFLSRGEIGNSEKGNRLLVTSEKFFDCLSPKARKGFFPVLVLESRSERSRFWVSPQGEVIEFKGLTLHPDEIDETKVNINSHEPEGLLLANNGEQEQEGLDLIGGIRSGATRFTQAFNFPLEIRGLYSRYGQLYRTAKPGERYFGWMRMDMRVGIYETLAELENVPLETFLHRAGLRLGQQVRRMHAAGRTLHNPFRRGEAPAEPFFSPMHSGNVEIHGNLVDVSGMTSFGEAEERFYAYLAGRDPGKLMDSEIAAVVEAGRFSLLSRASDLQRLIGGRERELGEAALCGIFLGGREKERRPEAFVEVITGIFEGYYGIKDTSVTMAIRRNFERMAAVRIEGPYPQFSFRQTYYILRDLERALQINEPTLSAAAG